MTWVHGGFPGVVHGEGQPPVVALLRAATGGRPYTCGCINRVWSDLDGDRQGKTAEHETAFRRYLGGTLTDEDRTWLMDRLQSLPGGASPEEYLRSLGTDPKFREDLAAELNAELHTVEAFFQRPSPSDSHALPYELGEQVGPDEEQTEVALITSAIRCRPHDFRPLFGFLQRQLDAAT
jgi:hypothetical protein